MIGQPYDEKVPPTESLATLLIDIQTPSAHRDGLSQ